MRNRSHFIGDLGEAAFVLRATQLRLPLYRPLSDKQGADFIADNRRQRPRIQVKTTGKRCSRNSYHVTIARGRRKSTPYTKSEIDFLVILVLPEETFYILPQKFLRRRVALNVPSTRRKNLGPYAQYKEAWHLHFRRQAPNHPRKPRGLSLQASADEPSAPPYDPLPEPSEEAPYQGPPSGVPPNPVKNGASAPAE